MTHKAAGAAQKSEPSPAPALANTRGTDAQILKERELTAAAIDGAMAFGYQNTNPPPEGEWLARWWQRGRDMARAEEIADRAMFEQLRDSGVLYNDANHIGIAGEGMDEVSKLVDGDAALREAFEWLQPRGYVELGTDADGEHIIVVRRPGE